jgi:hypothetical protein
MMTPRPVAAVAWIHRPEQGATARTRMHAATHRLRHAGPARRSKAVDTAGLGGPDARVGKEAAAACGMRAPGPTV